MSVRGTWNNSWRNDSTPPPLGNKIRLYTTESNPYGHRTLLVLDAKNIPYEVIYIDPINVPEWFHKISPHDKIPVLEVPPKHGGGFLFESVVICDFLDNCFAHNQLQSTDAFQRATDRLLVEAFNTIIKGVSDWKQTNGLYGGKEIREGVKYFEKELETRGTTFFGGNKPGFVDYMIWPWAERIYALADEHQYQFYKAKARFPNLNRWEQEMTLDPAVKKNSRRES